MFAPSLGEIITSEGAFSILLRGKLGKTMLHNRYDIKQAIGSISLEQYIEQGILQQCLPKGILSTLEEVKGQADEVWKDGDMEVCSFDFEGYTLNITFHHKNAIYLFDSMDIWQGKESNLFKDNKLDTLIGIKQYANSLKLNVLWFKIEEEDVCLLPNGVTMHYLRRENQRVLSKVAGTYRSYEDTKNSLQSMSS